MSNVIGIVVRRPPEFESFYLSRNTVGDAIDWLNKKVNSKNFEIKASSAGIVICKNTFTGIFPERGILFDRFLIWSGEDVEDYSHSEFYTSFKEITQIPYSERK